MKLFYSAKQIHLPAVLLFLVFLSASFAVMNQPLHAQSPQTTPFPNKPLTLLEPCALDPRNLVLNGSMSTPYNTRYGTVANVWTPFSLYTPVPYFRWAYNDQIDFTGSQEIYANEMFDAGIYQTVHNLRPGTNYWFRLGYSQGIKEYDGPDILSDTIGRKVGVDPLGGADPRSPNVIWGADLFDGKVARNRPEMGLLFTARATDATIFLRAMARNQSVGVNRVWFDAVCMEARSDLPPATTVIPEAKSPTATLTRSATATATSAPIVTPTALPTQIPTLAPTTPPTPLPLPTLVPSVTPPRPAPTPGIGAASSILQIFIIVSVLLALIAIALFVVGYWWWRNNQVKQGKQPPALIEPRSFLVGLAIGFALALVLSAGLFLLR